MTALAPTPLPAPVQAGDASSIDVDLWDRTRTQLAEIMVLPERTIDADLSEWVGPVSPRFAQHGIIVAEPLVAAGMALGDVIAFARANPPAPSTVTLEMADLHLFTQMCALNRACPWPMTVRDAVGWVLVHGAKGSDAASRVADLVRAYYEAGFRSEGWLYFAAGFAPDEAATAVAQGSLDRDRARMMAALRGSALPVEP